MSSPNSSSDSRKDSTFRARRSTRRRRQPDRFEFHHHHENTNATVENRPKRRKTTITPLSLLQQVLPKEILETILCDYVSSLSDRFSLQTTSKLFCKISNSPHMLKKTQLVGTTTPYLVHSGDTSGIVAKRLLPFAQNQNKDAILMLGLIATYVEDDLEIGLTLLEHGSTVLGDPRATFELGNLLYRDLRNDANKIEGHNLFSKAAQAGHVQSQIYMNGGKFSIWRKEAEIEMKAIHNTGWEFLLDQKPNPPRAGWEPIECEYHFCFRRTYPLLKRRCSEWLQTKGFSKAWSLICPQVQACCGDRFTSSYFDPELFFCVPIMFTCNRCRHPDYCGRACQALDWSVRHQSECRNLQQQQQG